MKSVGASSGKDYDDVTPAATLSSRLVPQLPRPSPLPDNPRLIRTAMPSAFWTGRFASVHDRFHNELLLDDNLDLIIEAQAARLRPNKNDSEPSSDCPTPSATAFNNPSISAYAPTRIVSTHLGNPGSPSHRNNHAGSNFCRPRSRIPHSATSGAIMQTPRSTYTGNMLAPLSHHPVVPPSQFVSRLPSHEKSLASPSTPRLFLPSRQSPQRRHFTLNKGTTNRAGSTATQFSAEISSSESSNDYKTLRKLTVADAEALTNDDSRCRRVFVHLEALCVTDEARQSLREWQQDYARRTKREVLLPRGGTMDDRKSGRLVERLLDVGRRSFGGNGPINNANQHGRPVIDDLAGVDDSDMNQFFWPPTSSARTSLGKGRQMGQRYDPDEIG
ncbi:hypothetical protein B0H63DRAFT_546388 [Podospora didyma]|uniref:Uncharacterized protein n=1 Tax=Podospora didyma TaxID=330526 RepID=A0AAE0NHT9_9PEZI|nr:hypothetical protein B0H63DRAFT_546388 [Podospora didyma]